MNHSQVEDTTAQANETALDELPIRLRFSDAALEMGFSPIPNLFLRFFPYLCGPAGEQLSHSEAFFLVYLLCQKKGPDDPEFFLKDLVCPFSYRTRQRHVGKFREMGIVLTKFHYTSGARGKVGFGNPPGRRIQSVEWILDSLFYNLSLVYHEWQRHREEMKQANGNNRVFYRQPDDFRQRVAVPPHLAQAVANGKFFHVSKSMVEEAVAIVEKSSSDSEIHRMPSLASYEIHEAPKLASYEEKFIERQNSALPNLASPHKKEQQQKEKEEEINIISAHFAEITGAQAYEPSEKEIRKIAALLAEGYSVEQICAGITLAVRRAANQGRTVRTVAYCLPVVRETAVQAVQEAEMGSPHPTAETGKPQTESEPNSGQHAPSASTLDKLANGDAELHELLEMVQELNPDRAITRAYARSWTAVADKYRDQAAALGTTPIGLVMQAVVKGVGSHCDRDGYFTPSLAEKILAELIIDRQPSSEVNTAGGLPSLTAATSVVDVTFHTSAGDMSAIDVWSAALGELKGQLSRATFDTLLRPTRVIDARDGAQASTDAQPFLVVQAPSPYAREWLEKRLRTAIERTVTGIVGGRVDVRFAAREE